MEPNTRKPRKTRAQWQELVGQYEGSGQSMAAFCKAEGLTYQTFAKWRQRLTAAKHSEDIDKPGELDFIDVTPTPGSGNQQDCQIELAIGDHIVIRIQQAS